MQEDQFERRSRQWIDSESDDVGDGVDVTERVGVHDDEHPVAVAHRVVDRVPVVAADHGDATGRTQGSNRSIAQRFDLRLRQRR